MCYLVQINKFVKLADVVAGRQTSLESHNTQGSLIWGVAVPLAEAAVLGNLNMQCCVNKGTQFTTLLKV